MTSAGIYTLLLGAGLLHALTHVFLKQTGDRVLTFAVVNCVSLLLALPLLYISGPFSNFPWLVFAASVSLHLTQKLFVIASYRLGDLSKVFPISRGASPIFALIGAAAFLDERIQFGQLLAIALIAGAIVGLSLYGARGASHNFTAVGYALITAMATAGYTIFDAIGARESGDVIRYIGWLYIADTVVFATFAIPLKRRVLVPYLKTDGLKAVGAGACAILSYGAVIYATQHGPIGIAATLRETSMIFATIIGAWVLREPLGMLRTMLSAVVFAGVLLLFATRGV